MYGEGVSIQTSFTNWSSSGLDWRRAPYESCSPNLVALNKYLLSIGGQHLGCHHNRDVRGGGAVSAHAYGAALDWRYAQVSGGKELGRQWALDRLFPWLINYSAELGIDAIHDYVGDRIWRAGRTNRVEDAHGSWWRKQNGAGSGMGEAWATYVHIESSKAGFSDARPIGQRGIPLLDGSTPPKPDPGPGPLPAGKYTVKKGDGWIKIADALGVSVTDLDKAGAVVRDGKVVKTAPVSDFTVWPGDVVEVVSDDPTFLNTPPPAVPPEIIRGQTGDRVKQLQIVLRVHADGTFGPKTEEAVKSVQRNLGVGVDGRYGPRTDAALRAYLKSVGLPA